MDEEREYLLVLYILDLVQYIMKQTTFFFLSTASQ